jgi:hypothetical protein
LFRVKRLERATLSTSDLEQQIADWPESLDEDYCFLGTRLGEETIALECGFLRRSAFQMKLGSDLNEIITALDQAGIQAEKRGDISPGLQKAVMLTDPEGAVGEIYADGAVAADSEHEAGIAPIKFGHLPCRINGVENAHSILLHGLNLPICGSSRPRALNKNGTAARKQPNA